MKRLPAFVFLLLALAAPVPDVAGVNNSKTTVKTIAVAELMQETNSFSPVLTTLREFEAAGLIYGEDI